MNLYYNINVKPQELPQYIDVRTEIINSVGDVDEHGIAEVDLTVTHDTIASSDATEQQIENSGWMLAPIKPEETDFIEYKWNGSGWTEIETEASKLRTVKWKDIRQARNIRIADTDHIIQGFIDTQTEIPQDIKDYRQSLRDLPQTYETGEIDDWTNVEFPVLAEIYVVTLENE